MAVSREQDTQRQLDAVTRQARASNLKPAWQPKERRGAAEDAQPWVWRWEDVRSCLLQAGELAPISERMPMRTVHLQNPTSPALERVSRTIGASIQHLGPGEITNSHRHTRTSLYFAIQGSKTYTISEGEQQFMEPGDLLIQPSWTWHSAVNEGDEPSLWLTVQDHGVIEAFEADFQERYAEGPLQPVTKPDGYHLQRLNLFRTSAALETEGAGFPVKYSWRETLAALEALAEAGEADPYDGVVLDYRDPASGGPTTLTIGCRVQLLRPGEQTKSHRHTGNTVYHVVRGSGAVAVGKTRGDESVLEWGERDLFFIPPWQWRRFSNGSSSEPAILFSANDFPLLRHARLYRETAG